MSRGAAEEKRRVERAVAHVLKRLNCNYNFLFQESSEEDFLLSLERSGRGSQDKTTYIVSFNPTVTRAMSRNKLRQAVLHEWLHAASWVLYDEVDTILNHIKPGPLKKELLKRYVEARENVAYTIERGVGPHVFPYISYDD